MSLFDVYRAILYETPDPHPFTVTHYQALADALHTQAIAPQTHILVTSLGTQTLVMSTLDMIYYHVAQGQWQGRDWMASFCVLCNAGSLFDARLNDNTYHFASQGFYDAMSLIADQETNSYWNHLTGVCLYGPLAGAQLQRVDGLLQMTASDALAAYPDAQLILMTLTEESAHEAQRLNTVYRLPEKPALSAGLAATLAPLDERLPRYDMGLGIWTATIRRYHPITTLYAAHNVLVDQLEGRSVVIVFDAAISLPIAFYAETEQPEFRGEELILTSDTSYRKGVLYRQGMSVALERPNQNVIRWYAFSALFPDCEIYGRS